MSLTQAWGVHCDQEGCPAEVRDFSVDHRALAYAARMGWHVRKPEPEELGPTATLCPRHAPSGGGAS